MYVFCIETLFFNTNIKEVLEIIRNNVVVIEIYIKVRKVLKSKEIK